MPIVQPSSTFDWQNLKFDLYPTNGFVSYTWKDGAWSKPEWKTDPHLSLHVSSVALNYGQSCFEGLKAFRHAEGSVKIFRAHENAARLALSADAISIPVVPEEMFLEGCEMLISRNLEWVPPYKPHGMAGSFYIRPLLFGSGPSLALGSASEFTFLVYGSPVGSLYGSAGLTAPAIDALVVETFDRSAPRGVGFAKLGGNYAPVFKHTTAAKKSGYGITLHLDSATRTYIDEFSTSNFVGLVYNKESNDPLDGATLVLPDSPSILKSITAKSVVDIAEKTFGWKVEKRQVPFEEVISGLFDEVAAAGTAAAITPIRTITYHDTPETTKTIKIGNGETAGKGFLTILAEITGIQSGDRKDSFDWTWPHHGFAN